MSSKNKRYITEIFADTVQLLGRKEDNQVPGADVSQGANGSAVAEPLPETGNNAQNNDEGDDLPF